MITIESLMEMASEVNGRRRNRILTVREAYEFMDLLDNAAENTKQIRVYSFQGFVANSYKSRAPISYFYATRLPNGDFKIGASTCDAKRSYGHGALITINGKRI